MDIKQILSQIRSLVSNAGGVEMSFGQPSKVNDLYVIPVAKVAFGFGGGGGSSAAKKKKNNEAPEPPVEDVQQESPETTCPEAAAEANVGGGGGGGMRTYPIGIYTIKGEAVKFHPVISIKEIIALITVISVLLMRMGKHRSKTKGKR
ncbi:MAG: hypothetical protein CVU50_09540 [Candidatus Cloacimonetes bacterium HGW-Cloacimonetes-3]|jgi:uncharacterized spore protein YtfJ|nr:MAG: hypothetical protein CVU50_09540 [Candidatus Cloacimonetes bacterium HGW-Cloacimonetes-3]